MNAKTLWSVVAVIWLLLCLWLQLGGWAVFVGVLLCAVFGRVGLFARDLRG